MLESNWSATLATLRPSFSVTFSHLIDRVVGYGINSDTVNKEKNGKILPVINKETKYIHGNYQRKPKINQNQTFIIGISQSVNISHRKTFF